MAKEERNERRIQIRLSVENWDRLQEMAVRYGMSANQLCSFAVGKWLDDNYRSQMGFEKMLEIMAKDDDRFDELMQNQQYAAMLERVMQSAVMMVAQNEMEKKS